MRDLWLDDRRPAAERCRWMADQPGIEELTHKGKPGFLPLKARPMPPAMGRVFADLARVARAIGETDAT